MNYYIKFYYFLLQPKSDMLPTMDVLKEYLGLIQEFPDTVDIHRGAVSKVKDCDRMKEEGRIDVSRERERVGEGEREREREGEREGGRSG